MPSWSAENATSAYLRAMRMANMKSSKEPNGAEFISALAAGNNVRFMVVACGGAADSTTLALVAAAQQTGGRIICVLPGHEELESSVTNLGRNARHVEFVVGEAEDLLLHDYKESDFVAVDCKLENHEAIVRGLQEQGREAIMLGYNAFCKGSWRNSPLHAHLLPIGEGLLVTRLAARKKKNSNWIVKVDKCTGEEHVFRVRPNVGRVIN